MKLLIIGSVASGKTTFSKKLSKKLSIKHFEIDSVVHDDEVGRKRTEEEQKEIFDKINSENNDWIIEGILRKNLYYLLDYADKIIFLDIPVRKRKIRIITRFIKQKLGIEKCNYKPTINMLKMMFKWTKEFEENKSIFEEKIEKYKDNLIILNTVEEVEKSYEEIIKIKEMR